jgi:hypothetical protein
MVPALACQREAPVQVNCCVWLRFKLTTEGETTPATVVSVTVALAEPLGPVAVTITVEEAGIFVGAVYKPFPLIVPAVADQLVAPAEVNCCELPRLMLAAVGAMACAASNVTTALAEPPGPLALTVTVPDAGIVDGAVYRPPALMLPAVALQLVAPAEVNCWVPPRRTLALAGEMDCAPTSVTVALAEPPGPLAVTVTVPDDGIVAGAVYNPFELMLPAVALQLVAPVEVNCCFAPSIMLAVAGEMVCDASNVTVELAEPPRPVAVIVTVEDDGIDAGAVYNPFELMLPAVAVQLVAPGAVNCCVAPRMTLAVVGEIV